MERQGGRTRDHQRNSRPLQPCTEKMRGKGKRDCEVRGCNGGMGGKQVIFLIFRWHTTQAGSLKEGVDAESLSLETCQGPDRVQPGLLTE